MYNLCLTQHKTPPGIRAQGKAVSAQSSRTGSIPAGSVWRGYIMFFKFSALFPQQSQRKPKKHVNCVGGSVGRFCSMCKRCLTRHRTPSGSRPQGKARPARPWTPRVTPCGLMYDTNLEKTPRNFTLLNQQPPKNQGRMYKESRDLDSCSAPCVSRA